MERVMDEGGSLSYLGFYIMLLLKRFTRIINGTLVLAGG